MARLLIFAIFCTVMSCNALASTFFPEVGRGPNARVEGILAEVERGQDCVQIGNMRFLVSQLERSGFSGPRWTDGIQRAAARCWALLLVRIYECLPLLCPRCGEPMRIIAFVLDPPVIERILDHIGEPQQPPIVLPARSPPQAEMDFDQVAGSDEWPEMDQTVGADDDTWD